jgi:hypothetical protein
VIGDQELLHAVTGSDLAADALPRSRSHMVDYSGLLSRPRAAPRDALSISEIVALLSSLPGWPTADDLTGPRGKVLRAAVERQRNGVIRVLNWLLTFPGDGWQERWLNAGADELDWLDRVDPADTRAATSKRSEVTSGLSLLMLLRVVIVSYGCLNRYRSGVFLAKARQAFRPDLFDRVEQAGIERGISREHLIEPMAILSRMVLQTGRDLDRLTPEDLLALYSWGLGHGGRKPYGIHNASSPHFVSTRALAQGEEPSRSNLDRLQMDTSLRTSISAKGRPTMSTYGYCTTSGSLTGKRFRLIVTDNDQPRRQISGFEVRVGCSPDSGGELEACG